MESLTNQLEDYVINKVQPNYKYPIGLVYTKANEEAQKGYLYIWIDRGSRIDHKRIAWI